MAGDNVVYGAFGQARSGVAEKAPETTAITQHTPSSLEQRFGSQVAVLLDLAHLLTDPTLPPEVGAPLQEQLKALKESADQIRAKLVQSHTDDQIFLSVQSEIATFGKQLIAFETDVLDKTGASISLVEEPTALAGPGTAMQWKDKLLASTTFWLVLSAGVGTVGALAYWHLNKKPRRSLREAEPANKFKKVKLRRALAAR